jgi:hypothetical protein
MEENIKFLVCLGEFTDNKKFYLDNSPTQIWSFVQLVSLAAGKHSTKSEEEKQFMM